MIVVLVFALSSAVAQDEYAQQLATLQTPSAQAMTTGVMHLRLGDSTYVPFLQLDMIPYDKREETPIAPLAGKLLSSEPSVVSLQADGRMHAESVGTSLLTYEHQGERHTLLVQVSKDAMPQAIANYLYVVNREYLRTERNRLQRSNQYTRWYYKSSKAVGWCSVFTIYCANASGTHPTPKAEATADMPALLLREGSVGNQYDGFFDIDRFVAVPKPGYLVIYADMNNAYRTVHIATVVAVQDMGEGKYAITTVEGNMSNTVKRYSYLYDSTKTNHKVGGEKNRKLNWNMGALPESMHTDPITQYTLHTDHWSVFGFCATW